MDEQDNGLTLKGLAHRLEVLERENTELRSKVARLESSGTRRDELAEKRGSDTSRSKEATSVLAGQVSRRALLSKAGTAAVAAVAAGTLLNQREAKASHFAQDVVEADLIRTHRVDALNTEVREAAVVGTSVTSLGGNYAGVAGYGRTGVRGRGGIADDGYSAGIVGSTGTGYAGVFVMDLWGKAQLRLIPHLSAGKPTTGAHRKGEIYMDSAARLFVCTKDGTPGTWRRINTTLV